MRCSRSARQTLGLRSAGGREPGRLPAVEPFLGDEPLHWTELCDAALAEDVGHGDVTRFAVPETSVSEYYIEAQAEGIVCGLGFAFDLLVPLVDSDGEERCDYTCIDGDKVSPGKVVMQGRLATRELLQNERTALNFLMHLSGIATLTRKFVDAVKGTKVKILDTRKTIPGLRAIEKYAVRCGGGHNHRFNLSDGVLIKDNHIRAAGGVREAIVAVRKNAPHGMRIEIECTTVAQVDRALSAGAEIILLDNMPIGEVKDAVSICKGRALLEVSGGVNLDNVREIAKTGVDYISVGMLTHSAPALPFHLELS
ncbi:carboxylating nicotinate-nucleotide diphosphorylase [Fimbriimonadia bacterium ATM]|nr:MAG: carboxylating nicotinate-nucleotide diphosphorylase [Armatimonadota bacterium]MBC6970785.1 carboxylating nicotinate-nucleotide diphosphorylase [Armatimonadota bacterium]MCE7900924.1 carboxylating nicotinate-nucleotide diphosphorylase [Armatimonadetes bacterium ATM1]MDL1929661.1 carboxylating nicotinate-nucleotide diphosphorylase [Fimbriimonadia bacterium ATM]RIJ94819.1 MAG: carboxylating nicotinate-nucleotide diphosphorylase [Armatimonadota bacterium]